MNDEEDKSAPIRSILLVIGGAKYATAAEFRYSRDEILDSTLRQLDREAWAFRRGAESVDVSGALRSRFEASGESPWERLEKCEDELCEFQETLEQMEDSVSDKERHVIQLTKTVKSERLARLRAEDQVRELQVEVASARNKIRVYPNQKPADEGIGDDAAILVMSDGVTCVTKPVSDGLVMMSDGDMWLPIPEPTEDQRMRAKFAKLDKARRSIEVVAEEQPETSSDDDQGLPF